MLLGGCVTVPGESCERFEQNRRAMRYDTVYRYSETDTRLAAKSFTPGRQKEPAAVKWYTLRLSRTQIGVCDHLFLTKDLYLHRNGESVVLHEQRDFYTAEGKLVATKREDVTGQLKGSGFYTASVPLPIPPEAPPGTYRIVTKLTVKTPNGAEKTLATSSAEFRVLP